VVNHHNGPPWPGRPLRRRHIAALFFIACMRCHRGRLGVPFDARIGCGRISQRAALAGTAPTQAAYNRIIFHRLYAMP